MKRLDRIIKIFLDDEYRASAEMSSCKASVNEQLRIYNELIGYEAEYKKKFIMKSSVATSINRVTNYRSFMARLKLTIDKQASNLETHKGELDVYTQVWREKKKKTTVLKKLNEKINKDKNMELSKTEQKELDDLVSSRSYHRKLGL